MTTMLLLLVVAALANGQLTILPHEESQICFLQPDNPGFDFDGNFTNIFRDYASVKISSFTYKAQDADIVEILNVDRDRSCTILAIYIADSTLDFNTFLQSENECVKYAASKKHYIKLPRDREYFALAKNLSFCPLNDDLIGIYCDTQLETTYFSVARSSNYDVTDIPEFTELGYVFHSNDHFYICERKSEGNWIDYQLFYQNDAPLGTVSQRVNWGNVWSNVKTVAQMVYKILDIFFGKRNIEPRA
uniref:Outer capsid glycoprotein VP7 n=1 Tax=Rotavirus B (isolate RVB/Rat/United States/IDIR/1984/G1P[X]) TaxID=28877 RepID=VP7_ROTGI|nr:RecName: Full=Outer capsid glycoprotein VP7; Flags: Precursor [IDIR agent]BAA00757.1 ORF [IDIR agent]